MDQYLALLQERGEAGQTTAQVLHPDGGVDENHAAIWRRGIGSSEGSLPRGWRLGWPPLPWRLANSAFDARGSEQMIRQKMIEAKAVDVMVAKGQLI